MLRELARPKKKSHYLPYNILILETKHSENIRLNLKYGLLRPRHIFYAFKVCVCVCVRARAYLYMFF